VFWNLKFCILNLKSDEGWSHFYTIYMYKRLFLWDCGSMFLHAVFVQANVESTRCLSKHHSIYQVRPIYTLYKWKKNIKGSFSHISFTKIFSKNISKTIFTKTKKWTSVTNITKVCGCLYWSHVFTILQHCSQKFCFIHFAIKTKTHNHYFLIGKCANFIF